MSDINITIKQKTEDGFNVIYPKTIASQVDGLSNIATSGSYNDLIDVPSFALSSELQSHATDNILHVTSEEKAKWNREMHTLTIGTVQFDGSEDVTINLYNGEYNLQ